MSGEQQPGAAAGAIAAVEDVGARSPAPAHAAVMSVLVALSLSHGLNDTLQAVLPAIYPVLKSAHGLNFTQIGLLTFVFQMTGSILQPLIGSYTDRRPMPYSLPVGMGSTLVGLVMLSRASEYWMLLVAAGLVGLGSAVFHPEASRLARLASGGRHGFAQSFFQVGGNLGSSIGPLLAAWVVAPRGQAHVVWFSGLALLGIVVLAQVGRWYAGHLMELRAGRRVVPVAGNMPYTRARTFFALGVLGVLLFSKFFYLASFTNYYTFYLIERFGLSIEAAQYRLFIVLFAFALGTFAGGPAGDRWGRKPVIWISILGVTPFALLLPRVGLLGCTLLTVPIGVILASAFSAILVYAQELMPGKVGFISGLFFGLAFGLAGIGSALLGWLADHTSVAYMYSLCAWLPLLGVFTAFLPDVEGLMRQRAREAV